MRPGPNTNCTSQRVCGQFGHSNNQYYKLLTQRRELPKLFQNCICHPPFLKKPNLDRNLLKNYRQVFNLSFISKLIEKVVAKQLNNYIDSEGLSNVNQSAYRRLHSTESALLKIHNDIAALMDSGKAVALTLLDLSAAFNTIDHDILFNFLRDWFGVDGTVLRWIKSYRLNRKQKVKLGNSFSDAFSLPYGMPQGSVLAPSVLPSILPFSVISFPISMSPTIYMLTRPKYI